MCIPTTYSSTTSTTSTTSTMPFGPFTLQWRTPSPNPPPPSPLPNGITRTYINTPGGPLELLCALPATPSPRPKPPLFFAHGGFGCAAVWHAYMTFFAARGYACYAISYRGHGASWYPSFWALFFSGRAAMAQDLVAGVREVERREGGRVAKGERVGVVLVAHSAGGALAQWVLGRGMVRVEGFCLLGGVPGFGSWSCYTFWAHQLSTPLNLLYYCFHPRYLLATTQQVHSAFFSPATPLSRVREFERLLSPYESMGWPLQALPAFVTGPDVVQAIGGWKPRGGAAGVAPRFLVLAAELDVLCTPPVLRDAASRYRDAFPACVRAGKLDGVSEGDVRDDEDWDGVTFKVVRGLGHHLQNHVEWERGAEELLSWADNL
ncbi:alpha/beta-hydrolase [Decorospora gaudefroyi]|uniref:Alpha/beta-hydrolase n=1 Tax=Decorospora gaudefroyi TaxID=184978 RepID=A0A6A5K536_9PLEO|nr:alpha/beta-hydrolase [Decorospora gaudefroyi]